LHVLLYVAPDGNYLRELIPVFQAWLHKSLFSSGDVIYVTFRSRWQAELLKTEDVGRFPFPPSYLIGFDRHQLLHISSGRERGQNKNLKTCAAAGCGGSWFMHSIRRGLWS
jgi:hypothetical protein